MSDDLRVGGLLSGTDVQGIVDALLASKAQKVTDKQEEIEDINEKIAAWADINASITELTASLKTLNTWETWNTMTATISDETRLTATATTAAINATYKIAISQLAQTHSVSSSRASDLFAGATASTDLVAAGILNAGDEFVVEGQTITIGATESLSSLMTKINDAAGSMSSANKVTASIMDNRLVITRNNTGATEINMSEAVGSPLQALEIFDAFGSFEAGNVLMDAQNALFTVNGASITRTSNTGLTDVITGVTLNLHDTTFSDITMTITNDTDKAKDAVLDFMDKYNAAIVKCQEYGKSTVSISGATGESQLNSVGLLSNDSLLQEIMRNMRSLATGSKYPYLYEGNASYTYNGRTGICNNLSAIGIYTISETNELSVTDEDRLDYMLENDFATVAQLFRGVYDEEVGYTHGIASDFYAYADKISAKMTGAIATRDARLDEQVVELEELIEKLLKDIDETEDYWWARFTAMEDTIASLQSDLSYLTSNLGM